LFGFYLMTLITFIMREEVKDLIQVSHFGMQAYLSKC
jgi:hypothetical protein